MSGQNSSGGPASFFVERIPLDAGGSASIIEVVIPTGGATIQSGVAAVNHVVDAGFSYDAAVFSSSTVRMFSCRVGFAGPFGFFPLTPQKRKLDTRGPGPLAGPFMNGHSRTVSLLPELPAGAAAALLNVTVTETVGGGHLVVYPADTTRPETATVNWAQAGQTVGNSSTVVVSPGGAVKIDCGATSGGQTHVVVDLVGYLR